MAKIAKGVDLEFKGRKVVRVCFIDANEDHDPFKLDHLLDQHHSLAELMGYEDYRKHVLDNELFDSVVLSKRGEGVVISRVTPMMRLRRALARLLDPGDGRQP